MTLVEVVAALVLAATALVGVLMASGLAARQRRAAQLRLEAVHVADELLAEWFSPNGAMPTPRTSHEPVTGKVTDSGQWSWRVSKLESADRAKPTHMRPFVVSIYRLDVIENATDHSPARTLATIEIAGSVEVFRKAGGAIK